MLTRLPEPSRVLASDARRALDAAFPERCWLTPDEQAALADRLAVAGIVGGAVYDALVGEAARAGDRTLITRDRRARPTYELLGVRYEFIA
ncbi:MAG TPA: hypothetical protein VNQ73_20665 [Ilumatobacter sp.]|nr:hypothetical protein [Ilumatobacter sp.]